MLDDANLDEAVKAVAWAGFGTTGQRCTATSRVIVHERLAKEFAERLVAEAEKLKIGDGLEPETGMGPLVNTGRVGAVHAYTEIGKEEGARLLTGGKTLDEGEFAGGAYYAPTIFTDATADMRIAQEEVFGPFVTILPVKDYDEAIARRQLDDLRPLLRYLHRERRARPSARCATSTPAWSISMLGQPAPSRICPSAGRSRVVTATASWGARPSRSSARSRRSLSAIPPSNSHPREPHRFQYRLQHRLVARRKHQALH